MAATRLPGLSGVVGKTPIPFNGTQLFDALVCYSYNPVFWYLFQLILLVALAPLVYTVMRGNLTGAAALGIMAFGLWKNWAMPLLNLDALFYFCAAAWASLHRDTWGRGIEERTGVRKNMTAGAILLTAMGLRLPWDFFCTWAVSEDCCGSVRFTPYVGGCGESAELSWL